ncbi:PBN1 [Candida oxycetoniae]|uniref:Protein PBN1 n=1 Tax=Candida oxycetoniae TaxID=497107 RepID=A0AAI9SW56_9ASCO|nr:PBN1 [Candida oxycetoniae]KAI3404193.2 PBN1 [Candida oxycetoniae]
MRQRVTIYYPKLSETNLIQFVNNTNLQVKAPPNDSFIVENKYTVPLTNPWRYICQLRIQSKANDAVTNEVFPFEFSTGLNIYILPKNTINNDDNVEFFQEVQDVLWHLLGIEIDENKWTTNFNSLYYYDTKPGRLNCTFFQQQQQQQQLFDDETFDLVYVDNIPNQIIIRSLESKADQVGYELETNIYKEIGLFAKDEKISTSKDDIVLSGMRVILDGTVGGDRESENKHKTLFHVKPRHRYLANSVSSSIVPSGLHPVLATQFIGPQPILADEDIRKCQLYYYINLNKSLIFDKYQDIPANAKLRVDNGIQNLELPEYKLDQWGSEVMFELGQNDDHDDANDSSAVHFPESFNLTLHSRYQLPGNNQSLFTKVINPSPQIFYACAVKEASLLEKSPFDSKKLCRIGGNYETYFSNETVFYHFNQVLGKSNEGHLMVDVPHGITTFDRINSLTFITLLFGIIIILAAVFKKLFSFASHAATLQAKKDE